jgi:hypothetical protein
MTKTTAFSRRTLVAGAAVAGTALLAGIPAHAANATPIAKLWAEAETLGTKLGAHRAAIAEAAATGGIPGWMRLGGEANAIAEARYGKLIAILNTPAKTAGDLAIIGKVTQDHDITEGARAWAGERLASAALSLAA